MSISRYIPMVGWLPKYRSEWLRFDIVAGLTTGAVVMPKAMAMATIAGLPVELGLYTALLPMAIYAIFGSSYRMSMSTTATIGMLTGATLTELARESAPAEMIATTATLCLMVGCALLLGSLLKLGVAANFISDPVLTGFKVGLGLVIVADQLPKLFGVHIQKAGFGRDLVSLWRELPNTSMATLILAAATLILIFALEHFLPRSPAPLFAVAGGIAASWALGLQKAGVSVIGDMPAGLPGFHIPGFSLMGQLWPAALGIALMSFAETVAVGRAFAGADDPRPDADQELRAIGLANVVAAFFHSIPVGGGTSQTAVNCRAGARSQISELATVGLTALAALFLAPVISLMPQATLAAVVIATSLGLMNPKELKKIWELRHMEFWWGVSAAVGVVLLGTLNGILVAVVISLLALIYETNRAPVYILGRKPGTSVFRRRTAEHPEDETFPGLLIVRTEGRMYFANAQRVGDRVWEFIRETKPKVVLLDCSAIPDIEYTALRMLINGEHHLGQAGISLWVAGLTPVALELVRRSELGARLGRERMFFDVPQAVNRFQSMLPPTLAA